jgi:hypothetical protein
MQIVKKRRDAEARLSAGQNQGVRCDSDDVERLCDL